MNCVLCVTDIDADLPFDAERERGYCQAQWPHQPRYLIVTGCYTRALHWHQGVLIRKGGEAFPIAAPASTATLGLWLVQEMLQAVEQITPLTPLSDHVFARFAREITQVIDWSKQATAADYADLAQAVLAAPRDPLAVRLLTRCAQTLRQMIDARPADDEAPVYLSGALAHACFPYLSSGDAA